MWAIKYVNKTSGKIIFEYYLDRSLEKRWNFLRRQNDIEIREVYPVKGIGNFLLCLFRKSFTIGAIPSRPEGEYRL